MGMDIKITCDMCGEVSYLPITEAKKFVDIDDADMLAFCDDDCADSYVTVYDGQ